MKYYTIHYKFKDYGTTRDGWWHGYQDSAEAAKAALQSDELSPKVLEIIGITEQGFDIGDWVVVKGHEIIDDEPGQVIAYAHDGLVIVEWKQFDFAEEFHWSELLKTDNPNAELEQYDDDIEHRCPACHSDYIAPNDNGYQCQACGSWWGV